MSFRILPVVALLAAILPLGVAPTVTAAAIVPTVTAISAGYDNTCALTSVGRVTCWGYGRHGALGNGTTISSVLPVTVAGLATGVRAIGAGYLYACALTNVGGVKCWGFNASGRLGDGTTTDRLTPVSVAGLASGATEIAVGSAHACALTSGGGVRCWGSNFAGQLGNGTTTTSLTPVAVVGLTHGVTRIAAGASHTCALDSGDGVTCWGSNSNGELGNGSMTASSVPVEVAGLATGVTAIAAGGFHSCALTSQGRVKCWGGNGAGQLGDGSVTPSLVPVDVSGLGSGVAGIAAGGAASCALTSGSGVVCWGARFGGGIGACCNDQPVGVAGLSSGVSEISVGSEHACAVSGGGVKCWGLNSFGQLGDGTRTSSMVPVAVDFAIHQAIVLRASEPAGTISPPTTVAFNARVSPVEPAGDRATVRFEIYRLVKERDADVERIFWQLAARRDVAADSTGRASLRWTFVTRGERFVRAKALGNATYATSPWSARVLYTVS